MSHVQLPGVESQGGESSLGWLPAPVQPTLTKLPRVVRLGLESLGLVAHSGEVECGV